MTNRSNSTQDTEGSWWMIERHDDPKHRPLYFCWVHRPGELPHTAPHGEHGWTPDWQRGEHFATREEAEAHTNGDPMLRVCDHAMMQSAMTQDTEDVVARLAREMLVLVKLGKPFCEKTRSMLVNPDGPDAIKLIQSLSDRIDGLKQALERVDDFIVNELAGDQPTMDYCQANPEAGEILLAVRAALHQEGIATDVGP